MSPTLGRQDDVDIAGIRGKAAFALVLGISLGEPPTMIGLDDAHVDNWSDVRTLATTANGTFDPAPIALYDTARGSRIGMNLERGSG